jgi:rhodanese-related sulfurtransferase
MVDWPFLMEPDALRAQLASRRCPAILDVRLEEDRKALPHAVPASRLASMADVLAGTIAPDPATPVVVVCHRGLKLSQAVTAELRRRGLTAAALSGGIVRWQDAGHPCVDLAAMARFAVAGHRPWVTRVRPKIDRVACPWLIRRFIDPEARFWYVEPDHVVAVAERAGAIPYDVPGVEISHAGELCSFDTLLRLFGLDRDPVLARLAVIVRGADTAVMDLAPEAAGLLAVSLGLSALAGADDHTMLEAAMPVYDALHAWALHAADETHSWKGGKK